MRQVDKMLREMAGAESVRITNRMSSATKLARLMLVAEQFGFMYGDTYQTGGQAPKVVVIIHRDPDPEAQRRAADSSMRYPQAGNGGDLPGMRPGGNLKPLREAAAHLELLKARINFDLTGKNAEKRMLLGGIGLTAGFVLVCFRDLFQGRALIFGFVGYLLCLLALGGGFLWNRKRNARCEKLLRASGLTPVQDETGRTRYLPPGGQLPGHHNPFAQQGFGPPQQAPGPQAAPAPAPGYQQPQPAVPQWQFPAQPGQQPQQPVPQGQPQPQYYGHPAQPQPHYGPPQPPAQYPNPYQQGQHS